MNDIERAGVYLVTRLNDYYITNEQAERVKAVLGTNARYIEIDGNIILTDQIKGILTPQAYQDSMVKASGGWYCKPCNRWLERNTKCGYHGR